MKKIETIFVRNNSKEVFKNRFAGEDFSIEPGKAEEMLLDCAQLVFGMGEDDKTRCLRRLGWMGMHLDYDKALKRLNEFSFHMENPKYEKHGKSADLAPGREGSDEESGPSSGSSSAAGPLGKLQRAAHAA